jgi:hypothetical protein
MKISAKLNKTGSNTAWNNRLGLTLVEMMVTMGIFTGLVVPALIASHLMGLKQNQLVESKLGASDQARRGFNKIVQDVRSAKISSVGNGNPSSFAPIPNGTAQRGNALRISLTSNIGYYVMYYFDSTDPQNNKLYRYEITASGSSTSLVADHLTDPLFFSAEDRLGVVWTTPQQQWRYVIHFTINFLQFQYPLTKVGTNYLYDFYKMEFKVTPHAPD